MQITIDVDGYFTGDYAKVGGIEGGVEYAGELPDGEPRAYRLGNGVLTLDAARLAEIASENPSVQPTDAERIAALEAAVLELITGGVE